MSTQAFGKYQLIKRLATGGMAEVWLAKQTGIEGFNRHVVIKQILPHLAEDPEFVQMFLNEAKIASRFNHPNIAQIYDLGSENGSYFIAMEFIHGEDLGKVMRRAWTSGQWVARHIALRIVADTCQGLYYAHTRIDEQGRPLKVVHRDISPQNILISFDGAVKLVDFGIAKAADQVSLTKSGAIKGKFAYMAPEQAGGKAIDGRTDIFALGLVLYELVTGVRPLKRESELATLQAALDGRIDAPSLVAEVPAEIDDVVMRALARSPDDRYRDAREFHTALEQYLVAHKEMATSVQVSDLMETLFADRLAEERRLGAPNPSTESSTGNPVASSFPAMPSVTVPPPPPSAPSPAPSETIDQDGPEDRPDDAPEDRPRSVVARAPQGTVGPSRRYAAPKLGETVASRSQGRGAEATRAGAREEEEDDGQDTVRPLPPPRRGSRLATPAPAESPRRRSSTGQLKRRTSSGSAMPAAPPRRSRLLSQQPSDDTAQDDISKLVDIEALRARARARLRAVVSVVMLVGAVVLIVVFREQIASWFKVPFRDDGVPVRLSVTTNPPTTVVVLPSKPARGRQPVELGRTPITEQSGALVGDTVLLLNDDLGIRWEEPLEVGEPNSLKIIEKSFKEVTLKVHVKPKLKDATIWRGIQRLGNVGVPLAVYPGVLRLEIRASQLEEAVPFELTIGEGQITEKTVDVSAGLASRTEKDK